MNALEKIRESLKEADLLRLNKEINPDELILLEEAAYQLKKAERIEISKIQKAIIKDMQEQCKEIEKQAREIRKKVSELNQPSKTLNIIRVFLNSVIELLLSLNKF